EDYQRALSYLKQIPTDGSSAAREACLATGNLLLLQLHRPAEAESYFRCVLEQSPKHRLANYRMAWLLGLCGRNRDAAPYRLRLMQLGEVTPMTLYLLCTGQTVLENVDELEEMHRASPDDPLLQLGLARKAADAQDWAVALERLEQVIAVRPDLVTAQALLGELLLETAASSRFESWYRQLPETARQHPDVWTVLGNHASRNNQPEAAIRCFWEAVRLDSTLERANWQLSQLLIAAGRPQQAEVFLQQSVQLEQLYAAVAQAWTGRDMPAVREAAELAEKLGLIREAVGWAQLMLKHAPRTEWARQVERRLGREISHLPLRRWVEDRNPALAVDLSMYPLPELPADGSSPAPGTNGSLLSSLEPTIRLEDTAQQAGLTFHYFNGSPPEKQTRRMYEFNGGGVAVLDYDQDGWPDLYLTQGSRWPEGSPRDSHSDRLFRNLGDGQFADVTAEAGLVEHQFNSGVTAGDFNNDGWPDLYVAGTEANRFLQNNGDGTFRDVTADTGTAGGEWSTSCLLADLNGDTWPDLYVVNYLSGEDVFTRLCPDGEGVVRSCSPRDFDGAQDRLYLSLGDGGFREVTAESGIQLPDGKGLGIVCGDFSGAGRLDLFIANDAVPNFYFVNEGAGSAAPPRFSEQALVTGLAMNADGRSEACMGVAAGDVNDDGLLDLFVTNFHNESNTLYQQISPGLFSDETRTAQLHEPGLKMLGFGTQFLDADLDGVLDLIVTNGHIDDLSDTGIPWRMPGQVFLGLGGGRFEQIPAELAGEYFTGSYLGRSLARLDWNRDGLEDAVISHLDAPVALLTNRTAPHGNFVSLQL
ncbi:MAG: VCBS repeat-containing protein, partial [Planctomycetaceae bacterium]|nr:VCBS repeat-containing protein [Planctomycetaceae bacterium]